MSTRILGFDPGTATTGWGFLDYSPPDQFTDMTCDCIITAAKLDLPERLHQIHTQATRLITSLRPQAVVIEKLFFNTNAKTAMSVGHARGVLLLTARQSGVPIFEYTPLQIKQTITGYGRADKKQIQFMVKTILKLQEVPKPDDAADALAAAITHAFTLR